MGWPWNKAPKPDLEVKPDIKPAQPADKPTDLLQPQDAASLLPHPMPTPTSIFEFGPLVPVGSEYMKGMCAGEDPDAIQACSWSIDKVQGKPKEKRHLYHIEF